MQISESDIHIKTSLVLAFIAIYMFTIFAVLCYNELSSHVPILLHARFTMTSLRCGAGHLNNVSFVSE